MAPQIKLPKDLQANLDQAERMLQDLLPQIDKAEHCGDNCQAHRENAMKALERIRNYKKHFGK